MSITSNRSHVPTRLLCILSAAVLYIATWPVVEMKCNDHCLFMALTGPYADFERAKARGQWVDWVYAPLHLARDAKFTTNPFSWYWEWWIDRLHPKFFLT